MKVTCGVTQMDKTGAVLEVDLMYLIADGPEGEGKQNVVQILDYRSVSISNYRSLTTAQ